MIEECAQSEPATFNIYLPVLDTQKIKNDLVVSLRKYSKLKLRQSVKWFSELSASLQSIKVDTKSNPEEESDTYLVASAYFDDGEYDRCAEFTKSCLSPCTNFLHYYSRYLSSEKKAALNMMEPSAYWGTTYHKSICHLASDLRNEHTNKNLDAFGLYVHGIVLKRLGQPKEAFDVLVEAVNLEPMHWGAWLELSPLIENKTQLGSLQVPNHWIKHFFFGRAFMDLQRNDDALGILLALQEQGFDKSSYIKTQIAMVYSEKRDVDTAIKLFHELEIEDPLRLDNFDTYSNLLYVKGMRKELANLACKACEIDKYRVETCCIVGNYYSLRSEHHKAVVYFQRALKLNPRYLSAWTLMGHEFMELKNINAAIHSYSQAVEVNRHDYRAWYGLGQTYEILKMYNHSQYYYKRAQVLRPNDSRMLIALGVTFEKLEKKADALLCYFHARKVGDIEGTALLKLAKLFEKTEDYEQATAAYRQYVEETEDTPLVDSTEVSSACKYLAHFFLKRDLDLAYRYAQLCIGYEDTKKDGEALLIVIHQERLEASRREDVQLDCSEQGGQSSTMETDLDSSS